MKASLLPPPLAGPVLVFRSRLGVEGRHWLCHSCFCSRFPSLTRGPSPKGYHRHLRGPRNNPTLFFTRKTIVWIHVQKLTQSSRKGWEQLNAAVIGNQSGGTLQTPANVTSWHRRGEGWPGCPGRAPGTLRPQKGPGGAFLFATGRGGSTLCVPLPQPASCCARRRRLELANPHKPPLPKMEQCRGSSEFGPRAASQQGLLCLHPPVEVPLQHKKSF